VTTRTPFPHASKMDKMTKQQTITALLSFDGDHYSWYPHNLIIFAIKETRKY